MNIRWVLLGALFCFQLASAEQKPAEHAPESPLPQVEINAQREKLHVMRAEMIKLEDQFFAEYNKLNTDHQYDVFCDVEAETGTLIRKRVCRPVFVSRATEEEAQALLRGDSAPPANLTILAKEPDYEKNVLAVINKNPQLRKLVREREALEKRYDAVRKQKLKGKIFVFD
jgi:hypothetical protein